MVTVGSLIDFLRCRKTGLIPRAIRASDDAVLAVHGHIVQGHHTESLRKSSRKFFLRSTSPPTAFAENMEAWAHLLGQENLHLDRNPLILEDIGLARLPSSNGRYQGPDPIA